VTPRATPFVTAIDHVQLAMPAERDRVYVDDPFGNRIELIEEGKG
jgi:hypothetical protein